MKPPPPWKEVRRETGRAFEAPAGADVVLAEVLEDGIGNALVRVQWAPKIADLWLPESRKAAADLSRLLTWLAKVAGRNSSKGLDMPKKKPELQLVGGGVSEAGRGIGSTPLPAPTRRLILVSKWDQHHPWPTVAALRTYAFHADTNGATAWIVRVGRRVLVDEAKFFEWARTVGEKATKPWSGQPGSRGQKSTAPGPEAA